MNLSERIESCITELDARRQQMAAFEAKVRGLMEALSVQGGTPGALGEALSVLEQLLKKYGDIDASCRQMIEGLQEIGSHLDRIEDGRQKIVDGVERILSQLSQLDKLASKGIVLGSTDTPADAQADGEKKPKRVLLIRMRPEEKPKRKGRRIRLHPDLEEDAEPEIPDPENSTIH